MKRFALFFLAVTVTLVSGCATTDVQTAAIPHEGDTHFNDTHLNDTHLRVGTHIPTKTGAAGTVYTVVDHQDAQDSLNRSGVTTLSPVSGN